jgi:hypothetical protein
VGHACGVLSTRFGLGDVSDAMYALQKKCVRNHPPGQKVYQRGAHTIWEVDGAKDKVGGYCSSQLFLTPFQLYCQNLSLFGKLFIDIKTLFFDCDNCAQLCLFF